MNAYLHVVDVDPESPGLMEDIGSYQTPPEVSIHNMMMFGTRACLTYFQDGVRIFDLADPTSPALVAYDHTFDLESGGVGPFPDAIGLDVDVEAGLVYVADIDRGLVILRDLTAEERVGPSAPYRAPRWVVEERRHSRPAAVLEHAVLPGALLRRAAPCLERLVGGLGIAHVVHDLAVAAHGDTADQCGESALSGVRTSSRGYFLWNVLPPPSMYVELLPTLRGP